MGVFGAVRDGAARVNRAPLVLIGMWLLTLLVSTPFGLADRTNAASFDWTLLGFPSALGNLVVLLDDRLAPLVRGSAAATSVALWMFLAGGIIDRYARDHATGSAGFFAACGIFFFRFLRLAVVQGIVYGLLFNLLRGWPADRLVVGVLVAAAGLIFDYAKVRAVVEDRRSVLGAVGSAVGFIGRNAVSAVSLYAFDVILFLVATGAYTLLAPGVGRGALAFAITQCYVLARLWVMLLFWASETALFQSRLAHAGYVARTQPTWPDSPEAEAIQ